MTTGFNCMGIDLKGINASSYASTPITNINDRVSETMKKEADNPLSSLKDTYTPTETSEDTLGLYSKKGQLYAGAEKAISKVVEDPELQSGDMQVPDKRIEMDQINVDDTEKAKSEE